MINWRNMICHLRLQVRTLHLLSRNWKSVCLVITTCKFCTSSVKQRRMQHREKGCHCCSQKNQQICSDWGVCIPAQSAHRHQETRRSWPKDGILGDSRKTYKAAIAKAFALPEFHIWFIYYGIGSSQKKLSWSAGLCVVSLKLFEFFSAVQVDCDVVAKGVFWSMGALMRLKRLFCS